MPRSMPILVASLLLPASLAHADDLAARGRATFEGNCVSCHVLPDPGLPADRLWLERITGTG